MPEPPALDPPLGPAALPEPPPPPVFAVALHAAEHPNPAVAPPPKPPVPNLEGTEGPLIPPPPPPPTAATGAPG